MAFIFSNALSKVSTRVLEDKLLNLSLCSGLLQTREKYTIVNRPRLRNPTWFTKKHRVVHDDFVTKENLDFIGEVVQNRYKTGLDENVKKQLASDAKEWRPDLKRTGVIARKIGIYPMWLNDGKRIITTLLQVLDNHVIKYYAPNEYMPPRKRVTRIRNPKACLLLGAEGTDPSAFTKDYCGLFKDSGVIPKKFLARFFVSSDAVLPLGTPINALHYQVGNFVDVRGKTIDRGFQGVMKKHGFKGMPASHGVTKTHRRGGNIGGGGEKGRVWPGTKMPGYMGNRYRITRGLKIWRINTKYNVLWVSGQAIPGETNSIVTIHDTLLPLRKPTEALAFPTYLNVKDDTVPEDIFDKEVHGFGEPTIEYKEV